MTGFTMPKRGRPFKTDEQHMQEAAQLIELAMLRQYRPIEFARRGHTAARAAATLDKRLRGRTADYLGDDLVALCEDRLFDQATARELLAQLVDAWEALQEFPASERLAPPVRVLDKAKAARERSLIARYKKLAAALSKRPNRRAALAEITRRKDAARLRLNAQIVRRNPKVSALYVRLVQSVSHLPRHLLFDGLRKPDERERFIAALIAHENEDSARARVRFELKKLDDPVGARSGIIQRAAQLAFDLVLGVVEADGTRHAGMRASAAVAAVVQWFARGESAPDEREVRRALERLRRDAKARAGEVLVEGLVCLYPPPHRCDIVDIEGPFFE